MLMDSEPPMTGGRSADDVSDDSLQADEVKEMDEDGSIHRSNSSIVNAVVVIENRMIKKNRVTAAMSSEQWQDYEAKLESEVAELKEKNAALKEKEAEYKRMILKERIAAMRKGKLGANLRRTSSF